MRSAPDFKRIDAGRFGGDFFDAYAITMPLMDTRRYLPYLLQRARALGLTLRIRTVKTLDELSEAYDIVVNCAGVWAGDLADDDAVTPIRGQVLRVSLPDRMDPAVLSFDDRDTKGYIVPRTEDCILGGTAEHGKWCTEPCLATARSILERCALLRPELQQARWLGHHVGLRPGRPTVRLEQDEATTTALILHNYGHGGAGYTLSWGCADELADLAAASATAAPAASA